MKCTYITNTDMIKVPLRSKLCFSFVPTVECLSFTVLNDVCAEFVFTFICIHFSVFIENQILRGGPMSMICDITTSLEANSGPVFNLHRCDVEA